MGETWTTSSSRSWRPSVSGWRTCSSTRAAKWAEAPTGTSTRPAARTGKGRAAPPGRAANGRRAPPPPQSRPASPFFPAPAPSSPLPGKFLAALRSVCVGGGARSPPKQPGPRVAPALGGGRPLGPTRCPAARRALGVV